MVKKKLKKTQRELDILKECEQLTKLNPKLKRKKLNKIKDLEKRLYYYRAWFVTESQPLHTLRNFRKRGLYKYHLDHIVSLSHGFYEGIPPEVIGHISNLRFIPAKENMRKGSKLTEASHRVLRRMKRGE